MNLLNQYSSDGSCSHSSSDHEEVKEKPRFPSIALALEDIPTSDGDKTKAPEELPKMKLSQKEITMQREVKQNMAVGENEYRYTEPAKLEVKMYKKRLHEEAQDNSDEE